MSVFPVLAHLPPGWGILLPLNVAVVSGLFPLIVYRVWRWWYRRSSPAAAAMALTVSTAWLLLMLAWWWQLLPPVVKAVEISGGPGVLLVSVLQLVVISLRGVSPDRFRRQAVAVIAAASCVLAVMAIAVVMSDATSVDLSRYRFNLTPDYANTGLIVATVTANIYMAAVLGQMVWLGVRRSDNTPMGWGVGLLAVGAAASLVQVVHGGICNHIGLVVAPDSLWLTVIPSIVCAVCLMTGLAAPPLLLYLQSRRKLLRLRPIRDDLVAVFPSLDAPMAPGSSRRDRVHEWCSQIQDGLTLSAQVRETGVQGVCPPSEFTTHAAAVTDWILGKQVPELNSTWLAAPGSVSSQAWILALGDRYGQCGLHGCDVQGTRLTG